ncbi:hypothetical protein [Gimesia chilikensis]|uniref:hypothetical protein n=1 Tax=Gimesia chilikensis TaxID=2605989 RepID=UPI001188A7DE|nr:hypothetical protein [Gimesia chilikensis]QDT86783.1 hypothetical protein MalM14_44620 [Gimesia chilikensis]
MNQSKLKSGFLSRAGLLSLLLFTAGLGCQDPQDIARKQGMADGNEPQGQAPAGAAEEMPAAAEPAAQPAGGDQKKSILQKTTAVVVDAKKALENPEIIVVDGKIKGVDPFSQAGSAYVSMSSRVSTLGMQQAIKAHKALNDRFPTYDEYMQMMKENRVEFAALPPYKMYGYDAESGNILVLEDKKKKAELYKEAGIPLD